VTATTDKNWAVRAAALEAIAQQGDRSLVPKITAALDDGKDPVRFGGRLYGSLGRYTCKDQRKESRLTLSSFPKDAAIFFA
jgi:HEAT repeat protein